MQRGQNAQQNVQANSFVAHDKYVVTVHFRGLVKRMVWDTQEELAIEHPAVHVLECTERGILIRDLRQDKNSVLLNSDSLDGKKQILLSRESGDHEIAITIHPVYRRKAAFLPSKARARGDYESSFYVSVGAGQALNEYDFLNRRFIGKLAGKSKFSFRHDGIMATIASATEGLRLEKEGSASVTLSKNQSITIKIGDLNGLKISQGEHWWRINRIKTPTIQIGDIEEQPDHEAEYFASLSKRLVIGAIFTLFLMWAIFPAHKEHKDLVAENPVVSIKKFRTVPEQPKKEEPKKVVELKPEVKKPEPKKPEPKVAKKEMPKPAPKMIAKAKPLPAKKQLPPPAAQPVHVPVAKTFPKAPQQLARVAAPKAQVVAPKTGVAAAAVPSKTVAKAPPPDSVAVQAKSVAASLDFLSTAPKNIAKSRGVINSAEANNDTRYAVNNNAKITKGGKSVLVAMADSQGGGVADVGMINTKSARNIATSTGVASGNGGAVGGRGKALNEVQGRVALNSLYTASGDGTEMAGALGGGGMTMSGSGSIAESELMKVLSKHLQKFQYCYEKALLSDSTLGGNLMMQWKIQGSGRGSEIKVVHSRLNNAALHKCISNELANIQFPKPTGGSVTVKYPFSFSSTAL